MRSLVQAVGSYRLRVTFVMGNNKNLRLFHCFLNFPFNGFFDELNEFLLYRIEKEIHEAQLQVKKEMLGEIEAAKQEAEQQLNTQRSEYEKEIKSLQDQLVMNISLKKFVETTFSCIKPNEWNKVLSKVMLSKTITKLIC